MPRLFVALDLDAGSRAALAAVTAPELLGARWVAPPQMHVTLRFLGPMADAQVPRLRQALATVRAAPFRAALGGVGVFPPRPSTRKPAKVLWAGIAPADPIVALKQAVDAALVALVGPDADAAARGFSPHVTLARFKQPPGALLAEYLQRHAGLGAPPFLVDGFRLYESRTLAAGPEYTVLESYGF
jgi:2'-5' RNA ligase